MDLLKKFDHLIFDLGQVIVDLSADRVIDGFSQYYQKPKEDLQKLIVGMPELYLYETGEMSDSDFIASVNALFGSSVPDAVFRSIWNSMLVAIPTNKLDLLTMLSRTHKTYILSNTNQMHQDRFDEMVRTVLPDKAMSDMVHFPYYSHQIGLRKPELAAYSFILDKHNLNPSKVVFFDDKIENIHSAEAVGISGIHVTHPDKLTSFF
ncbi:MAG: HAD superfamily hydrolase (TIGR01509 family) [Cyclobacteriaceae bacterium]|jgi:HAD superfamily hydrolase (TIGR01509 family)